MARIAAGEPATAAELRPTPADALRLAQQLIDADRPFHAHEVLEAAWKAAPDAERAMWKGLAQLAVGLTHARRGNARGAAALLRRGADAVGEFANAAPHGVDAGGVSLAARSLAGQIDRSGLESVTPVGLRLRLALPAP